MSDAAIIVLSYIVLSVGTYIVWPSRWNILAHFGVAFALIAYVIPVLVLHQEERYRDLVRPFAVLMLVGAIVFVFAMVLAAAPGRSRGRLRARRAGRFHGAAERLDALPGSPAARRLVIALAIGIALTCLSAVMMGGLPLFREDPFLAKYFRGQYAVSPLVSIVYRVGTGILTVLPALAMAMAVQDKGRRTLWMVLSLASLGLMLASMQRGSMAQGVLLVLVAYLIMRGRTVLALASLIGFYVAGSVLYAIMVWLGFSQLVANGPQRSQPFWDSVAAGVPDVLDALSFYNAWLRVGEPLTYGRTSFGGLVPMQFEWNPAVWALEIQNYGVDVSQIQSGGLRLPLQLWGMASFGWVGVLALSAVVGWITGRLVRRASQSLPRATLAGVVAITMLLQAGMQTVANLDELAYLEVFKAVVLLWVLWPALVGDENARARAPRGLQPRTANRDQSDRVSA